MKNKVEFLNSKYIIVTIYKKVWYKKNPIERQYIFRGFKDKFTNELFFNGYQTNKLAEIEIYKYFTNNL